VQHSKVSISFFSVDLQAPQWDNLLILKEYNALGQEHIQDFLKGDSNSRQERDFNSSIESPKAGV